LISFTINIFRQTLFVRENQGTETAGHVARGEICAALVGKPARHATEMHSRITENNIKVHLEAGRR